MLKSGKTVIFLNPICLFHQFYIFVKCIPPFLVTLWILFFSIWVVYLIFVNFWLIRPIFNLKNLDLPEVFMIFFRWFMQEFPESTLLTVFIPFLYINFTVIFVSRGLQVAVRPSSFWWIRQVIFQNCNLRYGTLISNTLIYSKGIFGILFHFLDRKICFSSFLRFGFSSQDHF